MLLMSSLFTGHVLTHSSMVCRAQLFRTRSGLCEPYLKSYTPNYALESYPNVRIVPLENAPVTAAADAVGALTTAPMSTKHTPESYASTFPHGQSLPVSLGTGDAAHLFNEPSSGSRGRLRDSLVASNGQLCFLGGPERTLRVSFRPLFRILDSGQAASRNLLLMYGGSPEPLLRGTCLEIRRRM